MPKQYFVSKNSLNRRFVAQKKDLTAIFEEMSVPKYQVCKNLKYHQIKKFKIYDSVVTEINHFSVPSR